MKKTRFLAVILSAALVIAMFSACAADKPAGSETTTVTPDISLPFDVPTFDSTTDVPTTADETTTQSLTGITPDTSYKTMAMTKEDVMALYNSALNNVKLRCPGFTKKEYQDICDVEAGDGALQLANRIMALVGQELLVDSGDSKAQLTVAPHDDLNVRRFFPMYDKDVGCELTDLSIITSATCYTDGKSYKLVITVANHLNPDPATSEFAKILTPIDTTSVKKGIEEYLVVLDMNQYQFDMDYTGNEITVYLDKETGRITSLSQKMIINVDINLNLDLIFFTTKMVEAKGTLISHLDYTDFIWD